MLILEIMMQLGPIDMTILYTIVWYIDLKSSTSFRLPIVMNIGTNQTIFNPPSPLFHHAFIKKILSVRKKPLNSGRESFINIGLTWMC
jgi:hypothetical protein